MRVRGVQPTEAEVTDCLRETILSKLLVLAPNSKLLVLADNSKETILSQLLCLVNEKNTILPLLDQLQRDNFVPTACASHQF